MKPIPSISLGLLTNWTHLLEKEDKKELLLNTEVIRTTKESKTLVLRLSSADAGMPLLGPGILI